MPVGDVIPLMRWKRGQLRAEIVRLRQALDTIRDCSQATCTLCADCMSALYPPAPRPDPPEIAEDDPVRRWRA